LTCTDITQICLPASSVASSLQSRTLFTVRPVTWLVSVPLQSHLKNIFCLHNFAFYKNPLFVLYLLHPAFICIQKTCPCQFSYSFFAYKKGICLNPPVPLLHFFKITHSYRIKFIEISSVFTSFPYMIWKQWQLADLVNLSDFSPF